MYGFTLWVIDFQEESMASGVRKVVRITRKRLMPSIPRWWLTRYVAV
jgi:hypothetical protein